MPRAAGRRILARPGETLPTAAGFAHRADSGKHIKGFQMAFFEDFRSALEGYPQFNVDLSITNVAVETGTAGAININEKWKFRVKVENNGSLNMNNLMLHVSGDNGAAVGTSAAGPFTGFPPIEVGPLTVAAGGSQKSDFLFFQ